MAKKKHCPTVSRRTSRLTSTIRGWPQGRHLFSVRVDLQQDRTRAIIPAMVMWLPLVINLDLMAETFRMARGRSVIGSTQEVHWPLLQIT